MSKLISVSEEVVKELNNIREKEGLSYSEAIKKLLPRDYELDQINYHFYTLEKILPDMNVLLETMRVITIRFYRLPAKKRKEKKKYLSEELQRVLSYIVKEE